MLKSFYFHANPVILKKANCRILFANSKTPENARSNQSRKAEIQSREIPPKTHLKAGKTTETVLPEKVVPGGKYLT